MNNHEKVEEVEDVYVWQRILLMSRGVLLCYRSMVRKYTAQRTDTRDCRAEKRVWHEGK